MEEMGGRATIESFFLLYGTKTVFFLLLKSLSILRGHSLHIARHSHSYRSVEIYILAKI